MDVRAISLAHAQGVNSFAPLAAVEAQLRAMLVRLSGNCYLEMKRKRRRKSDLNLCFYMYIYKHIYLFLCLI